MRTVASAERDKKAMSVGSRNRMCKKDRGHTAIRSSSCSPNAALLASEHFELSIEAQTPAIRG